MQFYIVTPTKSTVSKRISNVFRYKCAIFRENEIPIFKNQVLVESCYLSGSPVCAASLLSLIKYKG
jgi:hypothetical protein